MRGTGGVDRAGRRVRCGKKYSKSAGITCRDSAGIHIQNTYLLYLKYFPNSHPSPFLCTVAVSLVPRFECTSQRRARRCGDPATGREHGACCPLRSRETPVKFGQGVRPQQVHSFLSCLCNTAGRQYQSINHACSCAVLMPHVVEVSTEIRFHVKPR